MRAEQGRLRATDRFAVLRSQLPFAAVTLVAVLVALTWAPWTFRQGRLVVPLVCALTATLLAAAVPWPRLPRSASAVVPLLNLLAVAFAEMADLPAGALILLPVLVLARAGRHGLMLAIVAGVAASWVPVMLAPGPLLLAQGEGIVELVLRPAVIVVAAIVLFLSERRSAARSALLAGQSALVEELLRDARADRQLLSTVLDTIHTKVMVFDGTGTIQGVNRAVAETYGDIFAPGRAARDAALPVLAADGRTAVPTEATPLVRAAEGERFDDEVVWAGTPDGARRAYRVSAAPLGGASGSVLAMEDLTRELEALAKREEFVSAVSHELRTPLTSVVGYLDLSLDDPDLGPTGRRNLEIAARNAGRLQILIENLLAAARGIEQATSEPVDLAALVRDVVEDEFPRAEDAGVRLRIDGAAECVLQGDRDLLAQVVDNLVSNAIKYSEPGGEVTITTSRDGAAADTVRLEVRDQGRGMSEEELGQVFDRFYRTPSARESTVQGTGLGLPITQQIVEDLGGRITLDSAVGEGTRATVELPTRRVR